MCSSSPISSTARAVGVPPTAAEGCSDAASVRAEASSALTAATSVARCMTLGRCSTKGASGTFIDEQCGREGLGDGAHGVLVLLEVLRRAGQRGGEREVLGVVAGAADRAGEHARGDEALVAAHEQLGRGADEAGRPRRPRCSRSARRAGAAASGGRSGADAVATRSRASTTLSTSPAPMRCDGLGDRVRVVGGGHLRRRRRRRRAAARDRLRQRASRAASAAGRARRS